MSQRPTVSSWYTALGNHTFPTLFIPLTDEEIACMASGDVPKRVVTTLSRRIHGAIKAVPGAGFVHADVCAPDDSELFKRTRGAVKTGKAAWDLLFASEKVRAAFASGETRHLAVHSFRRMDTIREFRMFIFNQRLVAMSQRYLDNHHNSLERRADSIWRRGRVLQQDIVDFLPNENLVLDVYLTSAGEFLILDVNPWGDPTDPLLLRSWDRDWSVEVGLKLVPKPVRLRGEVEVSF
ncbi:MAG: hypothetical protein ACI8W8_001622 [Rhodothermales bacterium]|jgi:hypothetical protein